MLNHRRKGHHRRSIKLGVQRVVAKLQQAVSAGAAGLQLALERAAPVDVGVDVARERQRGHHDHSDQRAHPTCRIA